jgi:DNA-binding beta-propeller fold protein YncE
MGGGGVAVLDIAARKYVGTVFGMPPTPRHLVLSNDGTRLYIGSNTAGSVSVYGPADVIAAAAAGQRVLKPLLMGDSGSGTRTIELSPDGTLLFAAINCESRLAVLDARTLKKLAEIPADSYPVGLGVTPQGDAVWVTSQGVHLAGGNSVSVYRVTRSAPASAQGNSRP